MPHPTNIRLSFPNPLALSQAMIQVQSMQMGVLTRPRDTRLSRDERTKEDYLNGPPEARYATLKDRLPKAVAELLFYTTSTGNNFTAPLESLDSVLMAFMKGKGHWVETSRLYDANRSMQRDDWHARNNHTDEQKIALHKAYLNKFSEVILLLTGVQPRMAQEKNSAGDLQWAIYFR
jgi:hypothetical protein